MARSGARLACTPMDGDRPGPSPGFRPRPRVLWGRGRPRWGIPWWRHSRPHLGPGLQNTLPQWDLNSGPRREAACGPRAGRPRARPPPPPLFAGSPGKCEQGSSATGRGLRTCRAWRRPECWRSRTRPGCRGRGPWRGMVAGSGSEGSQARSRGPPLPGSLLLGPVLVWGRGAAVAAPRMGTGASRVAAKAHPADPRRPPAPAGCSAVRSGPLHHVTGREMPLQVPACRRAQSTSPGSSGTLLPTPLFRLLLPHLLPRDAKSNSYN